MGCGENPHTGELSPFNKVKWAFLIDSKYKFSNQCCNNMKKAPIKSYAKHNKRHPITAQMAEESRLRKTVWLKKGCNAFENKYPMSNPMSFWTEQDIYHYIKQNNIPICSVYGDIIVDGSIWGDLGEKQLTVYDIMNDYSEAKLKTTGMNRTGCMFCGYGCHLEKPGEGRFERMKQTHPKQYEYIMKPKEEGGLDYKNVIDWLNENGGLNIKY